jgi:hypothetical protein
MNNLKNAVGLLNAQAPDGEFLAYINEDEAKILKDAGGSGLLTPQGIPSYFTEAQKETKQGKAMSPGTGATGGHRGGGRDPTQQFSNTPPPSQMAKETLAKQRETLRDNINPPTFADKVSDLIDQGGVALSVLTDAAKVHNEWRRDRWFTGKEKTTLLGDKPMPLSRDFYIMHNRPYDKKNLMIEGTPEHDMLKDSGYFEHINRSSNNNDRDDNNPQSYFDYSEDFSEKLITQPNPVSQVDQYFSNMGNTNLGISNDFLKTYNKAKDDLAKTLNMTTNASQFGYNANMSSSNIYYNYLKDEGLL